MLVPEKLFLVYPKALAGRLEVSTQLRKDVEVLKPKVYGGEERTINVEEVRQLVSIVFRLEALSSSKMSAERHKAMTETACPADQVTLEPVISVERTNVSFADSGTLQGETPRDPPALEEGANAFSSMAIKAISQSNLFHQSSYLGPRVSEEMTDEELLAVLESLLIRLENTLSTLVSSVRAASGPRKLSLISGSSYSNKSATSTRCLRGSPN